MRIPPNMSRAFLVSPGTPQTLVGGSPTAVLPTPLTVAAIPGALGTLLVEYQIAESGTWLEWPAGDVATATIYVLTAPVHALRFTATTDDGTVEIAQ